MKSAPWPTISEGAKDCVRRLLKQNPKDRMTAMEALDHPWLREGGVASDDPIDDTVMKRLKSYSQMTKFKKAALQAIAANMTDSEIQGLKELFLGFDKDRSGFITLQELQDGLDSLSLKSSSGKRVGKADVKALLQAVDVDKDGTISYEEFIAATIHLHKIENEETLWAAFQSFDTDHSGFITAEELTHALETFGTPLPMKEVTQMIAEVDSDRDGRVNYQEFVEMMRGSKVVSKKLHSHTAAVGVKKRAKTLRGIDPEYN
mmetsp:Transcript_23210/g.44303  ORF Transcript_23210/g.44303 Transcript_23210/m.44303 type:complete len:261 (+) Transcript_23210:1530-2312(+)